MGKTGALVLLENVVATALRIQELIQSFEWGPAQKLGPLRANHRIWEAQIHRLGLSTDPVLLALLRKAQSNLDVEKAIVERGLANVTKASTLSLPLHKQSFALQIRPTVDRVTSIFDETFRGLSTEVKVTTEFQKRLLTRAPALECRADHRYIRLEETSRKVVAALRSSSGPSVVLLHGGPGKGKSCLARDVALQFQEDIDKERVPDDRKKEQPSACNLVFEQVVLLECGPDVEVRAKQIELRDKLGWLIDSGLIESDITISKSLANLLKDRTVLIVLDNVWNTGSAGLQPTFLQRMLDLDGKKVKWVVTSQLGGLCEPLNHCNFTSISMEDVTLVNARRILAAHIGLQEKTILKVNFEMKGLVDRIIHKLDANPLAMACVAPAVDKERYNEMQEWKQLEKGLSKLLHSKPVTQMQSKGYSHSFWEAIQMGFDLLNKAQQNLLILMGMCKGSSSGRGSLSIFLNRSWIAVATRTFQWQGEN